MSLLLPLGLAALVALPIVVLLHMRHTTPTVRPVPTLRFWLAAEPERTEQTRFRRPPLSLLLLLHLLIAGLLAVALARPATGRAWAAFGVDLRTEPQHLIVLLDGSTSMAATDTESGRTRFEEARDRAVDRLAGLREGDVATVLLLGTRTATFGATDAASLSPLRERVATVAPPGGRADLDTALGLAKDLLLPDLADRVVLFSDGALTADRAATAEVGAPIELVRVGGAAGALAGNAAVVELASRAAPDNPDLLELYARVVNFSDAALTAPVALVGDGLEIGRQTVTLPPNGGSARLTWPLPPGVTEATVRVETADALVADDAASLTLHQEGSLALNILVISDAPSELQRALSALEGARVTTEPSANLATATAGATYDLIVFEKSAPAPDPSGRTVGVDAPLLVVNPPPGGPFPANGTMLEPTVTDLRTQDRLLAGVDLAGVTFGETPVYALDAGQTEVVGAAEGPLVFRAELGQQPAVVLAFDVAASNLPRRVAFPILVANAVAELAPGSLPASVPLGDPLRYRPRAETVTVRVTPPGPEAAPTELSVAVAEDRGGGVSEGAEGAADDEGAPERLREVAFVDTGWPGAYAVTEVDAAGEALGGGRFWVNAGHARESDLRPNADLPATLAGARGGGEDGGARAGLSDLWPLLAALGLAVLGVEWLVALLPRRRAVRYGR